MSTIFIKNGRQNMVALWLFCGLLLVIIQVLLGGITRITESGLSITEWKPLSGALFPLSEEQWQELFDKYRQIDQYQVYFAQSLHLSEFKYLYFWEWFHRNWARFIGIVFIVPFVIFYVKKIISKQQARKYAVLALLGGIQAFAGWIMVASGLKRGNVFVEPLFLALHFVLALLSLAFILHFLLELKMAPFRIIVDKKKYKINRYFFVLIMLQLLFGAFLAGLHGAPYAPTFPTINGEWVPQRLWEVQPFYLNFVENPIMAHFMHRGLAYILAFLTIFWTFHYLRFPPEDWSKKFIFILPLLVSLQIILGILVLWLTSDYKWMSYAAIAHQFIGMCIFLYFILLFYLIRPKPVVIS